MNDPLITNIELPISEMEAQLLIMALKELPDDVDGMKELMKKRDYINSKKIDLLAHSNLMFKDMLLHRISASALKNDPIMQKRLIDSDYEEV